MCIICFNPGPTVIWCFANGTILTHSSFKNVFKSSTICQKFFTEISLQTVSGPYFNNIKNSLLERFSLDCRKGLVLVLVLVLLRPFVG